MTSSGGRRGAAALVRPPWRQADEVGAQPPGRAPSEGRLGSLGGMPDDQIEHEFPSTYWASRPPTVAPVPTGTYTARRRRSPFRALRRLGRGTPVLVSLEWLGGPNAHWLVRARGVSQAVPGIITLEDLTRLVRNDWDTEPWGARRPVKEKPLD